MERWRPVPGYSRYEASDHGRIRSLWWSPPRILACSPDSRGRPQFALSGKTIRVALVIARTWLPEQPPGTEVCHNNGDNTDNRPGNLRWDTHSANMLQAVAERTHIHSRRDTCRYGHPLDGRKRNKRSPTGWTRYCLRCERDRNAERRPAGREISEHERMLRAGQNARRRQRRAASRSS